MTVADAFAARRRASTRAALIPYVMAGDPHLARMPAILAALSAGGADAIELGFPFSDPLADGPTIQRAAQRARSAGATFDGILEMMAALDRSAVAVPILAFSYFNPLFVRGLGRSARDLARAGFAGLIVPDLPMDEATAARIAFADAGVEMTLLVAPTTPIERAAEIAAMSSGFVYVVSRMGVTGAQAEFAEEPRALVSRLRTVTEKPLAVGFGVSSPAHAAAVGAYADGVVVGSALVDQIARAAPGAEAAAAGSYCASLAAAMERGV